MNEPIKIFGVAAQIDLGNVAVAITTIIAVLFAWMSHSRTTKGQLAAIKRSQDIEVIHKIISDISEFHWKSVRRCHVVQHNRGLSANPSVSVLLGLNLKDEAEGSDDLSRDYSLITTKISLFDQDSKKLLIAITECYVTAQAGNFDELSSKNDVLFETLKQWTKAHNVHIEPSRGT